MNEVKNEFLVCGISIRTNNKLEFGKDGHIGKLWERFFKENILSSVQAKDGHEMYGVYFNYESDHKGDYDYMVGMKVKSSENSSGLKTISIKSQKYLRLKTDQGPIYQVVPSLWQKVWNMDEVAMGGKRTFKTDFEIYGPEAQDPNHAVVELYLGIE